MTGMSVREAMIRQSLRFAWRTLWGSSDKAGFMVLPVRYRRTLWFLWHTRGLRAVWRFLVVKVLARGERVGMQLLDPIEIIRPEWTPFPYMIEIEVTTRCHLKCTFCERTHFPKAYQNWCLTYAEFVRLMEQLPGLRYINLTGEGSAFLNPDFPAMLRYCREHRIYTTVIDSFTALTEEQMRLLIECAHKVPISLDGGCREDYERIRVGASWDTVKQNIRRFVALREEMGSPLPELAFRFIFCKDNYLSLPFYPRVVADLLPHRSDGIDGFVELVGLLEFAGTERLVWEPDPKIVRLTEETLHWTGLPHAWSHPSHDPDKKRPMRECAAWAEPYVMAGGYVIPCCSLLMSNRRPFLQEQAFGNVHEQTFREIWESPRYRAFRRQVPCGHKVPVVCEGCRAFDTTRREALYGIGEDQ